VFDVSGNNPADQTRVQVWNDNGTTAQKWGYDSSTKQIKGLNNKCLDAGDINDSNNRWLRIHTCDNNNNKKWYMDDQNRLKSFARDDLLCRFIFRQLYRLCSIHESMSQRIQSKME
jgi:hypothetical protein